MFGVSKEATKPQEEYFAITNSVPEQTWYWLALASIVVSALLKLQSKDHWALFVGQWPPTFLLFGIYHRVVKPSK